MNGGPRIIDAQIRFESRFRHDRDLFAFPNHLGSLYLEYIIYCNLLEKHELLNLIPYPYPITINSKSNEQVVAIPKENKLRLLQNKMLFIYYYNIINYVINLCRV